MCVILYVLHAYVVWLIIHSTRDGRTEIGKKHRNELKKNSIKIIVLDLLFQCVLKLLKLCSLSMFNCFLIIYLNPKRVDTCVPL